MKGKRLSKVQRLDIITTLPKAIIETILCLLPIEEAARTSILSREWRYKWTTIPKLVFCQRAFKISEISNEEKLLSAFDQNQPHPYKWARRNKDTRCKLFSAIHQVLLQRQGPILEFTLSLDAKETCFEIDQIILHLSRNHNLKKLTLSFSCFYGLPLSILPWHHLTDLHLKSCTINHKPIFNGFGKLTSLSLYCVSISRETLIHLLSNCPSLKSLCLLLFDDDLLGSEHPGVPELFKCLPSIEHLTTWDYFMKSLVRTSVLDELPTSLSHLKYCQIKDMCFVDGYGLPFLVFLIKCSPNLEKIKLEINTDCCTELKPIKLEEHSVDLEKYYVASDSEEYSAMLKKASIIFEKYSNVWLEHMTELEIEDFSNFKPEMEFVKFILARSPNLKKVILLTQMIDKNEEREMLKILLGAPRASLVEISVNDY